MICCKKATVRVNEKKMKKKCIFFLQYDFFFVRLVGVASLTLVVRYFVLVCVRRCSVGGTAVFLVCSNFSYVLASVLVGIFLIFNLLRFRRMYNECFSN